MKEEGEFEGNQAYFSLCYMHTKKSVSENFNKSIFSYSLSSTFDRSLSLQLCNLTASMNEEVHSLKRSGRIHWSLQVCKIYGV